MSEERFHPVRQKLREMVQISRSEFVIQSMKNSYPVNRGFSSSAVSEPDDTVDNVNAGLPLFKNMDCKSWIERMINHNYPNTVKILDLGCGNGNTMSDIGNTYFTAVEVSGITAHRYTPEDVPSGDIVVGNINYLNRNFHDNEFDIVYSYMALEYTHANIARHIRQVYRVLKQNGVAFLQEGTLYIEKSNEIIGLSDLERWLKQNKYEFEFGKVASKHSEKNDRVFQCAFRKSENNPPRLLLPVSYDADGYVQYDPKKAERYSQLLTQKEPVPLGV